MTLQPLRSVGGFNDPPDSQSEILREMARKRANDNTWNMVQTGMMAAQLAAQSAIHDQMEEVKRQNANALAVQQELLNREQLQQYLEEFVFQTEKLVEGFSAKSDVPASTRYFLLQSVLAQVEEDGIDTATIRGRDNKAAFEKAMANVHQLIDTLLKDPEVQEAIEWAEKQEAKRFAKQQKIEARLSQLQTHRAEIESSRKSITYAFAANDLFNEVKPNVPSWAWIAMVPVLALATFMVVPLVIAAIVAAVTIHRTRAELEEKYNSPVNYQLSVIDEQINGLETQLKEFIGAKSCRRTGTMQKAERSTGLSPPLN